MSKTSYTIDLIDNSVDTKLVTIPMPSANTLNINIIHQKVPLVINRNDLEPTNDDSLVFKLKDDVAASNGLKSLRVEYRDAGLFSGPTISYDENFSSVTFSEPVDEGLRKY
ncbi:hypothetical protein [Candidatus Rickettsia kedanie]|uniref:Uncharacterized protein n=1 Tax=Candidatus Rickettsia kedanie TaxID=3115352 RepID=A0ABP9TUG1_9RICK